MRSKMRLTGLLVLVAMMLLAGVYLLLGGGEKPVTLRGYVGGEKIDLLDDSAVQDILERK